MGKENFNFPLKLSRRELLKLGGATLGAIMLGGCDFVPSPTPKKSPTLVSTSESSRIPTSTPKLSSSPTSEPTRTRTPEPTKTATRTPVPNRTPTPESRKTSTPKPTPTRTSVPTRTSTPEPTKTPTPEPPKLLEKIETGIPGLSVERYEAKFQDITSEVPEPLKRDIKEWVAQPEFPLADNNMGEQGMFKESVTWLWSMLCQFGRSFVATAKIRPNEGRELFYYNGEEARFYTNIFATDAEWYIASDVDKKILNCGQDACYYPSYEGICISRSGKILYPVILDQSLADSKLPREAVIIADIPNGTKTGIKDMQRRYFESRLASDGSKLLLSLAADPEAERGIGGTEKIYLLDLNSGQVLFEVVAPYTYLGKFLNEDGSRLYLDKPGCMYNTLSGEKNILRWPTELSSYGANASPNLDFVVRLLGMFSASEWVEGQWGMLIYTSRGFFRISSPDWSFAPWKVDNEGNVYTNRNDIFKFEGGTYKLVRAGLSTRLKEEKDGKSIEVRVTKLGGG